MKVTFIIGAFFIGGAERVMSNLSNWFVQKGEEVTLITITEQEQCYPINEKVKVINGIGRKNDFDAIVKLRKIIKKENPDVVLSFLTHINIAVILAMIGTGIPVVISERNDPKRIPPELYRRFLRKILYPFAKGIVFQTNDAMAFFCKAMQKKSEVIPNPINLCALPLSLQERKKIIVSVARFVPQKKHKMLIRAFTRISDKNRDYSLHLYGDGDCKDGILKLINDLKMEHKVILKGESKHLHQEIRSAEIFALVSDYEGMPNALMEAMGLGLACISTNCPCGGPEFLIQNGQNGILIPIGDEDALTNALDEVINNIEFRERISLEAQKISERLNSEEIYQKWYLFLQKNMRKSQ